MFIIYVESPKNMHPLEGVWAKGYQTEKEAIEYASNWIRAEIAEHMEEGEVYNAIDDGLNIEEDSEGNLKPIFWDTNIKGCYEFDGGDWLKFKVSVMEIQS